MLISYNDVRQFAIEATDGRTGRVEDFYFDDESWRVRYLVTETGSLFSRQQGLVKSTLLGTPDLEKRTAPIALTEEQLKEAVPPDSQPPVSKQREDAIRKRQFDYWPAVAMGVPGAAYTPVLAEHQLSGGLLGGRHPESLVDELPKAPEDPHMRSMAEMLGYAIEARDGRIGTIVDFLLDPDGWKTRYVAADTGTWLPGRQVAIRPDWIASLSWEDQSIAIDEEKAAVEQAPELSELGELERSDATLALVPYGAYGAYGGFPI